MTFAILSAAGADVVQIDEPYMQARPGCGMKCLPRDIAFAKLTAMVAGAKIVRRELGA